jgi:hypothetical protein
MVQQRLQAGCDRLAVEQALGAQEECWSIEPAVLPRKR